MPADTFIPTRASLLVRLKDWEDQASWQGFLDTYGRLIHGAALKSGLAETEAEDVVQETFLAVARNIGEFRYEPAKCSFKSWLLLITRQRIIWQLRQREKPKAASLSGASDTAHRDGPRTSTIDRFADPAAPDL